LPQFLSCKMFLVSLSTCPTAAFPSATLLHPSRTSHPHPASIPYDLLTFPHLCSRPYAHSAGLPPPPPYGPGQLPQTKTFTIPTVVLPSHTIRWMISHPQFSEYV
jgi:hypothetical protein